jgi:16S rRNA (uracil1498-N3)-methyltransferase
LTKKKANILLKYYAKKTGDILFVTNGLGYLFTTEITIASDNKCTVKINSFEKQEAPKFKLHLAVAPTKMNERYEWFLEKATEIGIQEITPIICEHSERKVIKTDRFPKDFESAMKQSLHYYLPKLNEPIALKILSKKNLKVKNSLLTVKKQLKNL